MKWAASALVALALAACSGENEAARVDPPAPTRTAPTESWAIAFVRDGSLALRASGGVATAITPGSALRRVVDRSPAFSPDGMSIAFVSDRGETPQDDLYVLRVGGGGPTRLTEDLRIEIGPAWRDRRRLVFVSCAVNVTDCQLAQVDVESGARTVLRDVLEPGEIAVGSEGELVYADGDPLSLELDLYSGSLGGARPARLTRGSGRDHEPALAPDGRIAHARDASVPGSGRDIYVLGAGAAPRRLTTDPADDSAPAWSPDGERIAWVRQGSEDSELWMMNADGSCARPLTDNALPDAEPSWDPRRSPGRLRC